MNLTIRMSYRFIGSPKEIAMMATAIILNNYPHVVEVKLDISGLGVAIADELANLLREHRLNDVNLYRYKMISM